MKVYNIIDTLGEYGLDKVSCFERPAVNILNSLNTQSGDCYILLTKINEFFNDCHDSKRILKNNADILGIELENIKYNKNRIIKELDNNSLILMSCDLKEIFYSKYYKSDSYPHYYLIKGYDESRKVYFVFDNEHMDVTGGEPHNFCLPFDIMKKANASYIKSFGNDTYVLVFRNLEGFNYTSAITYVIDNYLSMDIENKESYRYSALLKALKDIGELTDNVSCEALIGEYKKKIVNIYKSKCVVIDKLKETMNFFGYDKSIIEKLADIYNSYERDMNIFTLSKILEFEKNRLDDLVVPDSFIGYEREIRNILTGFKESISKSEKAKTEGNRTDVIKKISDNSYKFRFNENYSYHWDNCDYVPKVVLKNYYNLDKEVLISAKIKIISNIGNCIFKAGFFVENANNEKLVDRKYFAMFNNENLLLLGDFDEYNSLVYGVKDTESRDYIELYMKIKENSLIMGEVIEGQYVERLKRTFANVGAIDVGVGCTTWDDAKGLEVNIYDIKVMEK